MKQLQHVVWSKGTFLTPQHLQMQDQYLEDLLQFQLECCGLHMWGLAELQVDSKALREGQFSILKAKGILPDGMLFDIPDPDEAPALVALNQFFSEGRRKMDIFLSVPEQLSKGANIGQESDMKTRFVSKTLRVRDDNTGAAEKSIQIARKNLKLLVDKNQDGNTAMQIARVVRTSNGGCELDENFIPPLIDIHGHDPLQRTIRGLVEIMAARSSQLATARRQKNQSLADFTVADIANFWLLYTINQYLPLFRHLIKRIPVHPEQLFRTMLLLAGSLTTFSSNIAPGDLPLYEHDQLEKCFWELNAKIKQLLRAVVPANVVSIPFKLVQPSIYSASIEDEKYLRDSRMYLAVSAGVGDQQLIQRAPALLKIGATAKVEEMIRRAVPGLVLTHVPNPSEIAVKLKYRYFSLDLTGEIWEGIQRSKNIGVYVPLEFPRPELELIILLPKGEQVRG